MTTLEQAALVAGFVAMVRKYVPKLDGWPVLLVAFVLSIAVCAAANPRAIAEWIPQALAVFVAAAGGTEWANRIASKAGQ